MFNVNDNNLIETIKPIFVKQNLNNKSFQNIIINKKDILLIKWNVKNLLNFSDGNNFDLTENYFNLIFGNKNKEMFKENI